MKAEELNGKLKALQQNAAQMEPSEQKTLLEAKVNRLLDQQKDLQSKCSDALESAAKTAEDLKVLNENLVVSEKEIKDILNNEMPDPYLAAQTRLEKLAVSYEKASEFGLPNQLYVLVLDFLVMWWI